MKKILVIPILVMASAVVCGIFFLLGEKFGVEHMSVVTAAPTDLAETMLHDEFYSTYRERTIMMTGKIQSISRQAGTATVTFPTRSQYQTLCSFNSPERALAPGQTVTVLTEGANAQRESTAVLLEDCVIVRP